MADLTTTLARIITCLSTPAALDRLGAASRTAPDEAILVTAPEDADSIAADARRILGSEDPAALVIDTTDGWEGLTLTGETAHDIFAHLSELHLPFEGFVQGDVGRLTAKVFTADDRITMFVPSPQAAYLRQRIVALGAIDRSEPRVWSKG